MKFKSLKDYNLNYGTNDYLDPEKVMGNILKLLTDFNNALAQLQELKKHNDELESIVKEQEDTIETLDSELVYFRTCSGSLGSLGCEN